MRNIDYYLGIPLCFFSTLLKKIFKNKKKEVKNILFIELSEMGSAILVDPAMRKAKKNLNANLHFLIFKKNKVSLELLNTVKEENIFTINESNFKTLTISTFKFLIWARKKKIDTVIDLELFSRFTALLSAFCGASNTVGFFSFYNEGLYRGNLLSHKVSYNPHIHIAKNFISLVKALENKEEIPYTKTYIDNKEIILEKAKENEDEKQEVLNIIKKEYNNDFNNKIVLINANASDLLPHRRWDLNNYIDIIKYILNNSKKALILLTGSEEEREKLDFIKNKISNKRCINFAGKIKFKQLVPLYYLSEFILTNDSGPAHFASTTSIHSYVIFGPETPKLYGSLGKTTHIYANLACSPCVSASNHRKTPCTDNVCLKNISSNMVISILKNSIKKLDE